MSDCTLQYFYNSEELRSKYKINCTDKVFENFNNLDYFNNRDFLQFIIDKYGSVETAKSTIKHYKHKTKGTLITKETYDLNATMLKIVASDYQSVDVYKFEDEANEAKRSIKLIDARLATSAFAKLREAMIENV